MTDEVKALLARAENGDLQAQLDLGHRYAEGRGVPRNDAEALRWYRRAADQGYASAQIALGHMHNNGLGVPRNPAEAARWWCLAADQGYHEAYFRLALLHENGRGVPQDDAEAMRLYEQALLASRSGHQGTLDGLRRVEARLQQAALAKAEPAPPRNHDTSPAGDAPIRGADQTWIDPDTGAPCVTLSAQDHEDSQFWRTYNLVLTNRCNLAFRIRAGVLRWDSNPLFQEQQRVIYRRQPGGEPTELRLSCMEARRPARSYEVGCRGFSGWSVTGVAEGW